MKQYELAFMLGYFSIQVYQNKGINKEINFDFNKIWITSKKHFNFFKKLSKYLRNDKEGEANILDWNNMHYCNGKIADAPIYF